MASARRLFHVRVEPMLRLLYWCACHHPSTTPGTVRAAGPPRAGMLSEIPRAAYHSMEAARAVHMGIDHGDGGGGGDGRVQRITPRVHRRHAALRSQDVRGGDHPARGMGLEPAR